MKKSLRVMLVFLFAITFLAMACDDEDICTNDDYWDCDRAWRACEEGDDTDCDAQRCVCLDNNGCDWGYDWFTCN